MSGHHISHLVEISMGSKELLVFSTFKLNAVTIKLAHFSTTDAISLRRRIIVSALYYSEKHRNSFIVLRLFIGHFKETHMLQDTHSVRI